MIFYVGIFGIFIQYVHALKNTCIYQRRARASNGSLSPNRIGELDLYCMNAAKTGDLNTDMWLASLPGPLARTCETMRAQVKRFRKVNRQTISALIPRKILKG